MLTYHCQFLLHGLSDHVGRGDVFNPQRRINGFMFFSLSVLNLEDHLGLVISPQSPLSAGYITLRACRRSLPLRFSTVTPGGIVGFLIVSYRFNIPDRLAVHLSIPRFYVSTSKSIIKALINMHSFEIQLSPIG